MDSSGTATDSFIHNLPKVELHVHLEGSVQPATLRELAARKGSLPSDVEQWISTRQASGYRYATFMEFVEAFKFVATLLATPQDYALAAIRLMEQLASQNVRYAEITLSAGVILWKKQPLDAIAEAVLEATRASAGRLNLRARWIFDAVRQFGLDHALQVVDWAGRYRSHGVVAFGIGGDEARGPAELFPAAFRRARDLGLHTLAHAGETAGPQSVRQAIELLQAERIGHGLTAIQDPAVIALLRERAIPVEVCLTSNVATGLLKRIEDHPLPRLLQENLLVSLHSDDPALFGTCLEDEFARATRAFSLSAPQLVSLCRNAAHASFLPSEERESLAAEIDAVSSAMLA